jgi:hypothetical protein
MISFPSRLSSVTPGDFTLLVTCLCVKVCGDANHPVPMSTNNLYCRRHPQQGLLVSKFLTWRGSVGFLIESADTDCWFNISGVVKPQCTFHYPIDSVCKENKFNNNNQAFEGVRYAMIEIAHLV